MTITVDIKTVYGNELIYPVCEQAHVFAEIAGTKTLTRYTLTRIKELGYDIEVKAIKL